MHGGFGAFIPVGIRIGLDALECLKAGPREVSVLYFDSEKAPCACIADDRSSDAIVPRATSQSLSRKITRGDLDITPWADRVKQVEARARYAGTWDLPVLGVVTAPAAVLIRPDGYVAWVGEQKELGLADALTTWFGPPVAA